MILGVISEIFSVKILFTSISALLTGVLSDLFSFFNPAFLKLKQILPALLKVSNNYNGIFLVSSIFIY